MTSNLMQKMPQIVTLSSLKPTSSTQEGLEKNMTNFSGQKRQTLLLPRPSPACPASPVVSDKTSGASTCGPSSEETCSRTSRPSNIVVPVKLWRNPNALLNDAPRLPACSSPQSTARKPELKCVAGVSTQSVALSRSDDKLTNVSSDAFLVANKAQNSKTAISTQGVLRSSTTPSQYLATHASGSSTQVPAATSVGAPAHRYIVSSLPNKGVIRVAVDTSKLGLKGPHIVIPKKPNVVVPITKLQNCTKDGSSLAITDMGNTSSTSLHRKHTPALVRVSSNSCRDTIRKLLENMHSAPQPITSNTPPSNQRVVSDPVKPGNCGVQVLQRKQHDATSGAAQPQASEEEQDQGYGFKILSIRSLAGKDDSPDISKQVSQVAARNNGGNANNVPTSSKAHEACQEKSGSARKPSEPKETLGSACNVRAGESGQTSDIIELCSFQTKKGNSVIASQIAFRPDRVSRNAMPCAKSDKLKEAIKLFEESMVQDTDLFSEREKRILTSLFRRVKSDTTAELEAVNRCSDKLPACSSKLAIKVEPTSPERRPCDSVFNVQEDERPKNLASQCQSKPVQHPGLVAIKAEPTSPDRRACDSVFKVQEDERLKNLAGQCQSKSVQHRGLVAVKAEATSPDMCAGDSVPNVGRKENSPMQTARREHGATVSHRPLRRIVITSDEVPVISSDKVKSGIETFLVQNNISNNFSEDEVIKLHWDGKDVSTFHFRDEESDRSSSPHLPHGAPVFQKIKPNILRCNKSATPVTTAGSEVSGAATVKLLPSGQTVSGTAPVNVGILPEQPKASTSGPTVFARYKEIRVKCVADSNQAVATPLESVSATREGNTAKKQLCFMPRAIRYIEKTGEIIDKPLKLGQPRVPVVVPIGTKMAPLNQNSAISLTSPSVPVVSPGSIRHVLPGVQPTTLRPQLTNSMSMVAKTISVPVTASHIGHVNTEGPDPKRQRSEVGFLEGMGGSANMPQATVQKPVYTAICDNDTARILEPEVVLEVSNKVIQVQPLEKPGLDACLSSSSSTSSCCSEDWAPPVQTSKKPVLGRKRASSKSSVQREYRSRKRRRRGNKQKLSAPPLDAKPKASCAEKDVAILSLNCIDRPCVVSMYHLNDRLMTKGFVNLASVKHRELFALARTPEVQLAPDKVVSVVLQNLWQTAAPGEGPVTRISENAPREMETDSLECLLREQINHLSQLRKKYKDFSSQHAL